MWSDLCIFYLCMLLKNVIFMFPFLLLLLLLFRSRVYLSGKMVPRVIEPTEEGEVRRREVQVLCSEFVCL